MLSILVDTLLSSHFTGNFFNHFLIFLDSEVTVFGYTDSHKFSAADIDHSSITAGEQYFVYHRVIDYPGIITSWEYSMNTAGEFQFMVRLVCLHHLWYTTLCTSGAFHCCFVYLRQLLAARSTASVLICASWQPSIPPSLITIQSIH